MNFSWPTDIVLQTDLSPSAWIAPRLLPWGREGTPVASVVPTGYPAYVRVLHPASAPGPLDPSVTWREVTDWSGRNYHSLMQFQRIAEPIHPADRLRPFNGSPWTGNMSLSLCTAFYGFLSAWTTSPDCWLGIWEGRGGLNDMQATVFLGDEHDQGSGLTVLAVNKLPRFEHPMRRYLLARTPIASVPTLADWPLGVSPNLAWPDDHAWCVGSEIDFDSTLVATSTECAAALVSDDRFEAVTVQPGDRLDLFGDVINR